MAWVISWTTAVGTALSWLFASKRCCGLRLSKSDATSAEMFALPAWRVVMFERCEAVTSAQFEIDVSALRMASRIPVLRLQTLVKVCASAVRITLRSTVVAMRTMDVAIATKMVRFRERLGARPLFGCASLLDMWS